MKLDAALELADWRRQVATMYAEVRAAHAPEAGWDLWRERRERLFLDHPQSPLRAADRTPENAPRYFNYDPSLRILAAVEALPEEDVVLPASQPEDFHATKVGTVRFHLHGAACVFKGAAHSVGDVRVERDSIVEIRLCWHWRPPG